jgi:hypothetical protein
MSYPWAQRSSPYRAQSTRFSSSVRISTFIEANPIAVTGAVLISLGSVWAPGSCGEVARVSGASHRVQLIDYVDSTATARAHTRRARTRVHAERLRAPLGSKRRKRMDNVTRLDGPPRVLELVLRISPPYLQLLLLRFFATPQPWARQLGSKQAGRIG